MKALGSVYYGRCTALMIVVLSCLSSAAAHADPSAAQAAYFSASRALMARMAQTQAAGDMPLVSDRRVARLLVTLDRANVVLNVTDTANEDVEIRICETSGQLLRAGWNKIAARRDPAAMRHAREQLEASNDIKYQDEIAGLLAFDVACAADAMLPASEIVRSSEHFQRQAVASQVWFGLLRMFEQMPAHALDRRIRLANRIIVLDAWISYIDSLAMGLPPATRADLARTMDVAAATSEPAMQWRLEHIGNSLRASGACGALCSALVSVPRGNAGP